MYAVRMLVNNPKVLSDDGESFDDGLAESQMMMFFLPDNSKIMRTSGLISEALLDLLPLCVLHCGEP